MGSTCRSVSLPHVPNPNRRRYALNEPDLDGLVEQLVQSAAAAWTPTGEGEDRETGFDGEMVRQIVTTGLLLMRDGASTGDIKLINSALKEMRHALRVFAPYETVRKVAVFGSARTKPDQPTWRQARDFAEAIVRAGWMVITGAGDGIMGAAQGGAGAERSFGVNIRLPFEQSANATIKDDHKLINFRYFFTRKVSFVKESHAIVLFPGGFGTHDEGFEALTLIQTGKSEMLPVVFVDAPGDDYWKDWEAYVRGHLLERGLISPHDLSLFKVTDSVDVAMQELLHFYSNYHSSRFVRDRLVLRVARAPDARQLAILNDEFGDIVTSGAIEAGPALPGENEVPELPRVTLAFNRRDLGRLRQLIDKLNLLEPADGVPNVAAPHQLLEQKLPPGAEEAERDGDGRSPT